MRPIALLALLAPLSANAIELGLPLACTPGTDCWIVHYVDHEPGPGTADSFCGPMTYDGHDGIDFAIRDSAAMRAGVDVVASAPGVVKAIRDDVRDVAVEEGGKEAVKDINCGNGVVLQHDDGWETQYCHMRRGSVAVRAGDEVAVGQKLGLVGLSGMTSFPHLHLTVRQDGRKLDPFHSSQPSDACTAEGVSLWNGATASMLDYQPLAIPVVGIADGAISAELIWEGRAGAPRLTSDSAALVVFLGAFKVLQADRIELELLDPDERTAFHQEILQERDLARLALFAGKTRPREGWTPGDWLARVRITRDGKTYMAQHAFEVVP